MSTSASTVGSWMSWEGGVDMVALSSPDLGAPNVIVHMARVVHTPVGSAPSGLLLIPGDDGSPRLVGFVSGSHEVGAYFGPRLFAGTPFEHAPVLVGQIEVEDGDGGARVRITLADEMIEVELRGVGEMHLADRAPGALPFHDHSLEAAAAQATLKVNGMDVPVTLPSSGLSGGPAAVWSPCGIYSR